MTYQPYTYLIGWTQLDKWYYGCQYGINANPSNLWKTYFTSSKQVKKLREDFGEPDVIQVRKIFFSKEKTRLWEHNVIRRLQIVKSDKWLNQGNGGKEFLNHGGYKLSETTKQKHRKPKPDGFGKKISKARKGIRGLSGEDHPMFGRSHSLDSKSLMSLAKKEKYIGMNNPFFGKNHSDIIRQHISTKAKERVRLTCPSCNKTMDSSNYKKYNHGLECKRFICL